MAAQLVAFNLESILYTIEQHCSLDDNVKRYALDYNSIEFVGILTKCLLEYKQGTEPVVNIDHNDIVNINDLMLDLMIMPMPISVVQSCTEILSMYINNVTNNLLHFVNFKNISGHVLTLELI